MKIDEFTSILHTAFLKNNLSHMLDSKAEEHLFFLADFLISENRKYNLTSITDVPDIIYKHFVDSLLIERYIPSESNVIDIGCGAGFPSLPLAITRPDLKITAIDSTKKKVDFVNKSLALMNLENLRATHVRAEIAAHSPLRDSFDVAIARAVAPFPVLSELCIPFVRPTGTFLAMKGPEVLLEFNAFQGILSQLSCGKAEILTYTLHGDQQDEQRTLISIEILGKTPDNFPRSFAQITRKPLT